jgi:hypothetical protein
MIMGASRGVRPLSRFFSTAPRDCLASKLLTRSSDRDVRHGCRPWCDTSTPQGELLVTILAGFATAVFVTYSYGNTPRSHPGQMGKWLLKWTVRPWSQRPD